MSETNTWDNLIAPFAAAIGKEKEAVTTALKSIIGEPSEAAFALLHSEENTPFDELQTAFSDVPKAVLRNAVKTHLRKAAPAPEAPAFSASAATASFDALPTVMDDTTWLAALKAGGELKVDQSTVISAIRAALANRVGLFGLPETLVARMEEHAEVLEEPVGADFFKMRKLLTRRSYSEIFAALEGVEGSFVTQTRKNALLAKLDSTLWPALLGFHSQLKSWMETWQQGSTNPMAMLAVIAAASGGKGNALPPGIMAPPDAAALRDAAESVIGQINKTFAGLGIPVARALAYDAHCVKEVLDNPSLPSQVGAANREQMLKMLRVDVTADYVRLERSVTRYALAVMEFSKVGAGNEELGYLTALWTLGAQIPWDKLGVPARKPTVMRGS